MVGPARKLLISLMVAATIVEASGWKYMKPPRINDWVKKIQFCALMSKITAVMDYRVGHKEALDDYCKVWDPFWRSVNVGESNKGVRDLVLFVL